MTARILVGDCRAVLRSLPSESVHCVVTSPPYWGLRDYGVAGQIGLEPNYGDYVEALVAVFGERPGQPNPKSGPAKLLEDCKLSVARQWKAARGR